jgi:hypothetical protein
MPETGGAARGAAAGSPAEWAPLDLSRRAAPSVRRAGVGAGNLAGAPRDANPPDSAPSAVE